MFTKVSGLLLATVMISSAATTVNAAATNAELKIGMSQEFENLNPLIGTMVATTYMQYLSNRNLAYLDANGKWTTQMAKSIPSLTNGGAKLNDAKDPSKGMTATWEILPKAKWGDGKDVTCNDLKFSWQAGLNDNVSVGERESYNNIASINWDEKTPKKCVITYKKLVGISINWRPHQCRLTLSRRSWINSEKLRKDMTKTLSTRKIQQILVCTTVLMSYLRSNSDPM